MTLMATRHEGGVTRRDRPADCAPFMDLYLCTWRDLLRLLYAGKITAREAKDELARRLLHASLLSEGGDE